MEPTKQNQEKVRRLMAQQIAQIMERTGLTRLEVLQEMNLRLKEDLEARKSKEQGLK